MSDASTTFQFAPAMSRDRIAIAEPFMRRVLETLERMVAEAPLEVLKEAAAAPTGAGAMATLVSHLPDASPALAAVDPEAAAVARAAARKRELLERIPTYTTQEVAALLSLSAEGVRKQRLADKLLAIEHQSDWRFPAFQFRGAGEVLPGLAETLRAMPTDSPWVRLDLMTTPIDDADGQTVVDLLRAGRAAEARQIVAAYGEHGA